MAGDDRDIVFDAAATEDHADVNTRAADTNAYASSHSLPTGPSQ